MLHLATYIMMPFMADILSAAPTPQGTSSAAPATSSFVPQNSTSIPPPVAVSSNRAGNQDLITQLTNAATAVDRYELLPMASDHLFDFNNPSIESAVTTGLGGHTVTANRKSFPALIGTGGSMSVGFVGPCGFNTPHTHPRAAEMNIVVQGRLLTEHIIENGGVLIRNQMNQYQMSVFPQGAIHCEFNPDCTPAVFVAGFPSEDAGVSSVAQRLFELDDDVLRAEFGSDLAFNDGRDLDAFRNAIPANVAKGVASCLQKCGITKR